jgi:hypothetical protein
VGRFFTGPGVAGSVLPEGRGWADTTLALPPELAPDRYVDLFTDRSVDVHHRDKERQLALAEVFALMPLALLVPKTNARSLQRALDPCFEIFRSLTVPFCRI